MDVVRGFVFDVRVLPPFLRAVSSAARSATGQVDARQLAAHDRSQVV
ncbi:hypothetical protein [Streptomyces sp. NPDC000618]